MFLDASSLPQTSSVWFNGTLSFPKHKSFYLKYFNTINDLFLTWLQWWWSFPLSQCLCWNVQWACPFLPSSPPSSLHTLPIPSTSLIQHSPYLPLLSLRVVFVVCALRLYPWIQVPSCRVSRIVPPASTAFQPLASCISVQTPSSGLYSHTCAASYSYCEAPYLYKFKINIYIYINECYKQDDYIQNF